jgi:polysaccharide biosynthesis PFTS motif protein
MLKLKKQINIFIRYLLWPDLRGVIKAYKKIQREGDRLFIGAVHEALTLKELDCGNRNLHRFFLGEAHENAEVCLRQILLKRLIGRNLNSRLLMCMTNRDRKLVYPLPDEWVEVLNSMGIKVAKYRAKLLFWCFSVVVLIHDSLKSVKEVFERLSTPRVAIVGAYVHLIGLSKINLPIATDRFGFTIVDWYLGWIGRAPKIRNLTHDVVNQPAHKQVDVNVIYSPFYLLGLSTFSSRAKHLIWFYSALYHVLFQALIGRPAGLLLLREAAMARRIRQIGLNGNLAEEYLFSCSQHLYRPLWTYVAEKYGALITMYYYSVSMPFEYRGKRPKNEVGLQSMTWSRILTFSKSHESYLKAATNGRLNIETVSPIYYSDYIAPVPCYDKKNIAVFDVTPVRDAERALLAPADNYRIAEVGIRFLEEIYLTLAAAGYNIVWKKKRSISKIHSKIYMTYAESFRKRPGVIEVHPDVAAARVVDMCLAVISMPFTSTAVLASAAHRPSVFYDPTGDLCIQDPAAFGLPVLVGTKKLKDWIDGLV